MANLSEIPNLLLEQNNLIFYISNVQTIDCIERIFDDRDLLEMNTGEVQEW